MKNFFNFYRFFFYRFAYSRFFYFFLIILMVKNDYIYLKLSNTFNFFYKNEVVTILRSPHANSRSRDQLGYSFYKSFFSIWSPVNFLYKFSVFSNLFQNWSNLYFRDCENFFLSESAFFFFRRVAGGFRVNSTRFHHPHNNRFNNRGLVLDTPHCFFKRGYTTAKSLRSSSTLPDDFFLLSPPAPDLYGHNVSSVLKLALPPDLRRLSLFRFIGLTTTIKADFWLSVANKNLNAGHSFYINRLLFFDWFAFIHFFQIYSWTTQVLTKILEEPTFNDPESCSAIYPNCASSSFAVDYEDARGSELVGCSDAIDQHFPPIPFFFSPDRFFGIFSSLGSRERTNRRLLLWSTAGYSLLRAVDRNFFYSDSFSFLPENFLFDGEFYFESNVDRRRAEDWVTVKVSTTYAFKLETLRVVLYNPINFILFPNFFVSPHVDPSYYRWLIFDEVHLDAIYNDYEICMNLALGSFASLNDSPRHKTSVGRLFILEGSCSQLLQAGAVRGANFSENLLSCYAISNPPSFGDNNLLGVLFAEDVFLVPPPGGTKLNLVAPQKGFLSFRCPPLTLPTFNIHDSFCCGLGGYQLNFFLYKSSLSTKPTLPALMCCRIFLYQAYKIFKLKKRRLRNRYKTPPFDYYFIKKFVTPPLIKLTNFYYKKIISRCSFLISELVADFTKQVQFLGFGAGRENNFRISKLICFLKDFSGVYRNAEASNDYIRTQSFTSSSLVAVLCNSALVYGGRPLSTQFNFVEEAPRAGASLTFNLLAAFKDQLSYLKPRLDLIVYGVFLKQNLNYDVREHGMWDGHNYFLTKHFLMPARAGHQKMFRQFMRNQKKKKFPGIFIRTIKKQLQRAYENHPNLRGRDILKNPSLYGVTFLNLITSPELKKWCKSL